MSPARTSLVKTLFSKHIADEEARLTRLGFQIGKPKAPAIPATFRSKETANTETHNTPDNLGN